MAITRAAEAPAFAVPGFQIQGLTAPSRGAQELCTWRLHAAPGAASDPHRLDHEEVFILLEGTLTVAVDGQEAILDAGDALAAPAGALLQVANRAGTPARAIVCLPAGAQAVLGDGQALGVPLWAR
ncbi:MAG TPA: cupin domain-containing protein [Chloroflexia bacterium]|nr:cupin domain-containing protein [Chloroflexia bacterium]